ncbi:hypothetical protein [Lacticaseibacillus sp. BCRC 81376]|uniref:hypothetical protein n=1 Tax=Lacticaseibacillus sp. BCRC 81376 TaxID=3036496 RepID=UPI00240E9DA2|nr:hypothetical protein [Lacticaseibacillus sp. BCRC 81376]MDG3060333.1 hypothetical protein [Lacticaseibacillus sp. BCRC 81376]MDG3060390.1 hypothetical protein [Lacticaseibacillus sp. BCRC 81376]
MKLTIECSTDEIKKVLQAMQDEEHSDDFESIMSAGSVDENGKVALSNLQIHYILSALGY